MLQKITAQYILKTLLTSVLFFLLVIISIFFFFGLDAMHNYSSFSLGGWQPGQEIEPLINNGVMSLVRSTHPRTLIIIDNKPIPLLEEK